MISDKTIQWLQWHTSHARTKHPRFASSDEERLAILTEEFEEVKEAFARGDLEHALYELGDLSAVAIRWHEGD